MNYCKWSCQLISPLFIFVNTAFASETTIQTVPFQNISLSSRAQIQANFSFGTHAEIFCFDNTLSTVGSVTWPYKGKLFSAPLPLLLTTNAAVQGQFSDPNGLLTIVNTTSSTLIVSCEFGF